MDFKPGDIVKVVVSDPTADGRGTWVMPEHCVVNGGRTMCPGGVLFVSIDSKLLVLNTIGGYGTVRALCNLNKRIIYISPKWVEKVA